MCECKTYEDGCDGGMQANLCSEHQVLEGAPEELEGILRDLRAEVKEHDYEDLVYTGRNLQDFGYKLQQAAQALGDHGW